MSGRLSDLTRAERRRAVALAIVKVFATWVVLFGGYYLAPVSMLGARHAFVTLLAASAVFVLLVAWQVRRIGRAKLPTVHAVQALGLLIPFFLVLFAAFYLSLSSGSAESFSAGAGSHGCALLHGDRLRHGRVRRYRPATSYARLVTSLQMLLDLVVLGAVVRIVLFAARRRIDAVGRGSAVPDQARALTLIPSNSAWVSVPASSNFLAEAISSAGLPRPATVLM